MRTHEGWFQVQNKTKTCVQLANISYVEERKNEEDKKYYIFYTSGGTITLFKEEANPLLRELGLLIEEPIMEINSK